MNRKNLIIFIIIVLVISIIAIVGIQKYIQHDIEEKQESYIKIAENLIHTIDDTSEEIITNEELRINDNVIGIIEIPKINVKASIRQGISQDILKYAVGHFENSSYWNGNVAIASHNRGSNVVHYFENINSLELDDELIYTTKFGERRYSVKESKTIKSNDWSVINNSKENKITLITCVKNNPDMRFCIIAKEI